MQRVQSVVLVVSPSARYHTLQVAGHEVVHCCRGYATQPSRHDLCESGGELRSHVAVENVPLSEIRSQMQAV